MTREKAIKVIEIIEKRFITLDKEELQALDMAIKALEQEPVIHAKWERGYSFPDGVYWKCSHCNELIKVKIPMHYCNNCGAKMVEPQESEDKE